MTTIVALPNNASKWQMGFNSAFKGLIYRRQHNYLIITLFKHNFNTGVRFMGYLMTLNLMCTKCNRFFKNFLVSIV
jgi:hypothetical protein